MQNKQSSYVKAILSSGIFYVGIILGVIISTGYVLADVYGYVDLFVNNSSDYVAPIIAVLAVAFVALVTAGFIKAKSKTVSVSELVVGFLAVFAALMIYVAAAGGNIVFAIVAIAVSLALLVATCVIRNKNFDSAVDAEKAESNATFASYYKQFFKTYGIVSVIFAVLALVSVILLDKANIVGRILSGNSLKAVAIAAVCIVAVLFVLLCAARLKSKEQGLVDVALFALLGGTIGLIPVAFSVGENYRTAAFVILAIAFVVTVVFTVAVIKNTRVYTEKENDELDKCPNGLVAYFKAFAKKTNFLAILAVSAVVVAVAIFAEGIKLPSLLIKTLNVKASVIAAIIFVVMAFAAIFVVADVKNRRITQIDTALCVWNLSFVLLFITDFAILGGTVGLKFIIMVVAIALGLILAIARMVFVRYKEEVKEECVEAAAEEVVEPVVNETVAEETPETVEESAVVEDANVNDETAVTEEAVEPVVNETVIEDTAETVVEEPAVVEDDASETTNTETPIKLKRVNSKKNYEIYLRTGDDQLKQNYSAIKNALYAYGVHSRMTKARENFSKKGVSLSRSNPDKALHLQAKLLVRGKFLKLYLNIDPSSIDQKYFRHTDASTKSPDQPTLVKIRSKLSLKRSIELIDMLAKQEGFTKKKKFEPVDYTAQLSDENLSYMQKIGFDYMVKDSVTLNEVAAYNDEFAKKIIKTQVIEKAERYIYDEITLEALSDNFADGEVADLEAMRAKGLIKINANCVTVKPSETLSKKLIVIANVIEPKAAEMIAIAGGECTQLIEG